MSPRPAGTAALDSEPATALESLAASLRGDEVIGGHVIEPTGSPALGLLVAAGPNAAVAPASYAFVIEAIREGYLLHHRTPRVLEGVDPDLALLAGDHLYALGLDRLAELGDLHAVRELGDLISLASQLNPESSDPDEPEPRPAAALWLASATAIAAGRSPAHDDAKHLLREGADGADLALWEVAAATAGAAGIEDALANAAEAIGFPAPGTT